jgi:hypothetical protein
VADPEEALETLRRNSDEDRATLADRMTPCALRSSGSKGELRRQTEERERRRQEPPHTLQAIGTFLFVVALWGLGSLLTCYVGFVVHCQPCGVLRGRVPPAPQRVPRITSAISWSLSPARRHS